MTTRSPTPGRRYPDVDHAAYGEARDLMDPGGYRRAEQRPGLWVWECCTPNGLLGSLRQHEVTPHEDGTITVSPSILVRPAGTGAAGLEGGEGWHGFLERGIWREV